MIREAAGSLGGGGGGREDVAQAGGRNLERLAEAPEVARLRSGARSLPRLPEMRILAIDHGDVRAGIAVCDLERDHRAPAWGRLATRRPRSWPSVAREQDAELIVVGVPVST